jgi:hypothetical protein
MVHYYIDVFLDEYGDIAIEGADSPFTDGPPKVTISKSQAEAVGREIIRLAKQGVIEH